VRRRQSQKAVAEQGVALPFCMASGSSSESLIDSIVPSSSCAKERWRRAVAALWRAIPKIQVDAWVRDSN
jgi:hypothetical protein